MTRTRTIHACDQSAAQGLYSKLLPEPSLEQRINDAFRAFQDIDLAEAKLRREFVSDMRGLLDMVEREL